MPRVYFDYSQDHSRSAWADHRQQNPASLLLYIPLLYLSISLQYRYSGGGGESVNLKELQINDKLLHFLVAVVYFNKILCVWGSFQYIACILRRLSVHPSIHPSIHYLSLILCRVMVGCSVSQLAQGWHVETSGDNHIADISATIHSVCLIWFCYTFVCLFVCFGFLFLWNWTVFVQMEPISIALLVSTNNLSIKKKNIIVII